MIYLQTIIFGIVQGITEFVPVSSSGHLVILHDFMQLPVTNDLAFDVALHIGTLTALIIYFYKDLAKYAVAFFQSLVKWEVSTNNDQKLAWLIALSIIPAGFVGYFFESFIESMLRSPFVVAIMLVLVAILFFVVEVMGKRNKELGSLGFKGMILIACAQALALIPGTSRSGITIAAGMSLNLTRQAAARFSFLMSVPIIFFAGIKKALDVSHEGVVIQEYGVYLLGTVVAAVIGYLAIKYMLKFLEKYSLRWFAWYRLILAVVVFIYLV